MRFCKNLCLLCGDLGLLIAYQKDSDPWKSQTGQMKGYEVTPSFPKVNIPFHSFLVPIFSGVNYLVTLIHAKVQLLVEYYYYNLPGDGLFRGLKVACSPK